MDTKQNTTAVPEPQLFSHGELLTLCKLLQKADMQDDEIYVKCKRFASYALQRALEGHAYIALSVS